MRTPLTVQGRFKIFDANNKLVATLEPTHRIEAEALARAYNAHARLVESVENAKRELTDRFSTNGDFKAEWNMDWIYNFDAETLVDDLRAALDLAREGKVTA